MTALAIGIPVRAEPHRLRATVRSVLANTPRPFELLLLPDGPDGATRDALAEFTEFAQLATDEPRGAPACFNRLIAATQTDVVVLLESGCLVGRCWTEGLLAAMREPRHGLAGPSTNASWNEQSLARHAAARAVLSAKSRLAEQAEVDRVADAVRHRFGGMVHGLEPLHSLADFCYALRRDVITAVGAADEEYGAGPCWEMDYNIRAARAGFRGVWVCGSYVQRAPFTEQRAADERRLMEASKRRYQDKFCARRLQGVATGYEPHCRGEACADFAPTPLIRIHAPQVPVSAAAPMKTVGAAPLVSCIMPTANRRDFVLQSIAYFRRQDYPACELLILDDQGGEDLSGLLPSDDRIRYFRLRAGLTIGAKRNRGCELARGSFIAQWDDDDWYAPQRLSAQVAPLRAGAAQITGLSAGVFFDLEKWQFWRVSAALHRRMFVGNVHGGTLVFDRGLFDRGLRYPDRSLAEDAWFLWHATHGGARLEALPGDALFVYLRHGGTSWAFTCGTFLDPGGWQRSEEPTLIAADRDFYAFRSPVRAASTAASVPSPAIVGRAAPLVTCIMPTANRRGLVPQAIRYFQRQDYPDRELLVVDDGSDPVADVIPDDPRIRYLRLDAPVSLGAKRNLACAEARGELILHWDDDDWMAASRVRLQAEAMQRHTRSAACGLANLYFFDPVRAAAWFYTHPTRMRAWVSGNTLCYRRAVWERRRFPDIDEGEDTVFVWSLGEHEVLPLATPDFFVALVHARNTSPKRTQYPGWTAVPAEGIGALIQGDMRFYEDWAARVSGVHRPQLAAHS